MSQGDSHPETRTQTIRGTLADLEKHVRLVFESREPAFMVTVIPPDERFSLRILRMWDDPVTASVSFRNGSKQAKAIRAFFAQHSLDIPENSGMPRTFLPNLPVDVTFDIAPVVPGCAAIPAGVRIIEQRVRVEPRLPIAVSLC